MTTGGTGGITGDCSLCETERLSLVNQLASNDISWRAYFEDRPRNAAAPVTANDSYNKHYNPFVYEGRVDDNPSSTARLVGFRHLRRDLTRRSLPRFSWIAPDVLHDGHNRSLAAADRYVRRIVPTLHRALGRHGVLYLTWDEGTVHDHAGPSGTVGGGRVALIAARRHARVQVAANHYALLRTIEANFGLPPPRQRGLAVDPVAGWPPAARSPMTDQLLATTAEQLARRGPPAHTVDRAERGARDLVAGVGREQQRQRARNEKQGAQIGKRLVPTGEQLSHRHQHDPAPAGRSRHTPHPDVHQRRGPRGLQERTASGAAASYGRGRERHVGRAQVAQAAAAELILDHAAGALE